VDLLGQLGVGGQQLVHVVADLQQGLGAMAARKSAPLRTIERVMETAA
jgi:hypothetical protein